MSQYTGMAVMVIMSAATIYYGYYIVKGKIKPTLAAWIIASVTMSLGLWTYFGSPEHSFWSNIGNVTGVVNAFIITIITFWFTKKEKSRSKKCLFKPFQILSLKISALIVVVWLFSGKIFDPEIASFVSNIAIQILSMTAGIVLMHRLLSDSINSEGKEGYVAWILTLIGSGLAIFLTNDFLAELYAWRSFITKLLIISAMFWMDIKNKRFSLFR